MSPAIQGSTAEGASLSEDDGQQCFPSQPERMSHTLTATFQQMKATVQQMSSTNHVSPNHSSVPKPSSPPSVEVEVEVVNLLEAVVVLRTNVIVALVVVLAKALGWTKTSLIRRIASITLP
mmetsp:Transcript_54159/g.150290  ORF Transcript_54159/g.150290 Transcript_54159/m.150290 type:complete len:121 (+) Transcript_54159:301-663(+)